MLHYNILQLSGSCSLNYLQVFHIPTVVRTVYYYFIAIYIKLLEDVFLPQCMLCGGLAKYLVTSVMWFSSGGTKSVLHHDDLENINCLYDGFKELVMIDKV